MVSRDHLTGLYVIVSFYFVLIGVCAVWAQRTQSRLRHAGIFDKLTSHYLGGRALGPWMTTGTIFASFYSGYTVVGIPDEAYSNGWMALRWVSAGFAILTGYFGTGLRLRKAGLVRHHSSPVDFITDRFQSQVLRYTVLFLQVVPALIYITAQVVALKTTFNSIFNLKPDAAAPATIIVAITLIFEWVGGMNCVALTDCVQGVIMLVSLLILPIIIATQFGGWSDLDPATYPKPQFYQTPTAKQQLGFWQFTVQTFTFFALPHLMQRIYAARDLKSLKYAYTTLTFGIWSMMIIGVFVGTVGVQMLAGEDPAKVAESPYAAVIEQVLDLGGFPKLIGLLAVTGSLAAIMSTADSLLIAISQLVTEELVYPMRPAASPEEMAWVGRGASFVAATLATILGLFWDEGITDLTAVHFSLSFQCVPSFLVGLFATNKTDIHPWCLTAGSVCSSIYVIAFYLSYVKPLGEIPADAGVTGVVLQLCIVLPLEAYRRYFLASDEFDTEEDQRHLIFPYRPDWDIPARKRFGEYALTPNLLWKMMEGVNEPLTNPWYAALMFFTISYMTPIAAEGLPANGQEAPTVNGLPWWVFKMLLSGIIPSGLLLVALSRMQNEFPQKAVKVLTVSDAHVMELTPEELGHRVVYDGENDLLARRRREVLANLGLVPTEIETIEEATNQRMPEQAIVDLPVISASLSRA